MQRVYIIVLVIGFACARLQNGNYKSLRLFSERKLIVWYIFLKMSGEPPDNDEAEVILTEIRGSLEGGKQPSIMAYVEEDVKAGMLNDPQDRKNCENFIDLLTVELNKFSTAMNQVYSAMKKIKPNLPKPEEFQDPEKRGRFNNMVDQRLLVSMGKLKPLLNSRKVHTDLYNFVEKARSTCTIQRVYTTNYQVRYNELKTKREAIQTVALQLQSIADDCEMSTDFSSGEKDEILLVKMDGVARKFKEKCIEHFRFEQTKTFNENVATYSAITKEILNAICPQNEPNPADGEK